VAGGRWPAAEAHFVRPPKGLRRMARKERRPVSAADKELLVRLQAALPSLRQSVVLSEAIANCSAQRRSRHPVLNFAFARAPAAVWENTLLRVAEALVLIDSALVPSGRRSLFSGKGRDRMPVDRDFADCIRLRHEVVAHRARRLGDCRPTGCLPALLGFSLPTGAFGQDR
jgi:hypothetical protein